MQSAAQLRDAGIQTAVDHADAVVPRWSDRAYALLVRAVSSRQMRNPDQPFMAEEVRAYAENLGLPSPPDPRAWGGVLQRASRAGLIVKAGYAESSNRQAHLRPTQQWRVAQAKAA